MRLENHYVWEYPLGKKWVRTRFHCSEEFIRREHPDARKVECTLIVREIAETDAELSERAGNRHAQHFRNS